MFSIQWNENFQWTQIKRKLSRYPSQAYIKIGFLEWNYHLHRWGPSGCPIRLRSFPVKTSNLADKCPMTGANLQPWRICYILNHLHHQHFLCILRGNNFQEIEHHIFPLKLVFIFQKVYYFFWRHNGSTLFAVLTWVAPPRQDNNCRRVSLTYYLQTTAVSFACGNLAGVWHFETADSRKQFCFPVIFHL